VLYTKQLKKTKYGERTVALKEIEIESPDAFKGIKNEVDIMSMCQHPNVLQMYDSLTSHGIRNEFPDETVYADIVLEFCDGGTLESYFKDNYKDQPFPDVKMIGTLVSVLKGLHYLHIVHRIVHRDLKPDNILLKLDPKNPSVPIVKIADFGLSKVVEANQMTTTYAGTPVFMAPEIFNGDRYDYKCDFWSVGGMFYYLRTHEYPLTANKNEFVRKMREGEVPVYKESLWSSIPLIKDLIQKFIVFDPSERCSWNELLSHKFLEGIQIDTVN